MSEESWSKVSEVFIIFKGYSHAIELYSGFFFYTKSVIVIIVACVFVMLMLHVLLV